MEANQLGRLQDILAAARLIAAYVQNTSEAGFEANTEKQDAVIRRIEIIGVSAAHLTEETRHAIPELPFRKMRGMRNIAPNPSPAMHSPPTRKSKTRSSSNSSTCMTGIP